MEIKKSKRFILILFVIYWLFAVGIYAISYEQFHFKFETGRAPESEYIIGEVVDGMEIRQPVRAPVELIDGIELLTDTYSRSNTGTLLVTLEDLNGNVLAQTEIPVGEFVNCQYTYVPFEETVSAVEGDTLIVSLTTEGCSSGNAITIYAGRTLPEKAQPVVDADDDTVFRQGYLCVRMVGRSNLMAYRVYWIVLVAVFAALCVYTTFCWKAAVRGKPSLLVSLLTVYTRYSFLIKQLVSRDFKTKYKRSALGMAWSILNPLLTMSVQYFVFSTLFKSNIPNYPVYLLTGIVFFNFFNETISLGMTSITSNSSLIKKVYMPKYIYPLSRVFSSTINFVLALVPLFLVTLLTKTAIKMSILLLVFDIVCFLVFLIGLTLLMTTAMTFFQDTQYLWSVVSLMWQYVTPIFYPETIIPERILPLYRINPMYQFITFARTCIIDGVSPEPEKYVYCVLSAGIVLLLGITVFKKHQDKFVLYL